MPVEVDPKLVAICGMNCMVCYKHLAMKRTIKRCHGCQWDDETLPGHCRTCRIKDCAKERQLNYCFECNDYPCIWIKTLDRSYRKRYQVSLIENGYFMKEHGLLSFLEKEQERWTCDNCGGIFSLHDQICSDCHKKIDRDDPTKLIVNNEVK